MGDPITTVAVVFGAILGTLSFEVGLNTLQNYYDTFYEDAFWEHADENEALQKQLDEEEKRIEMIFRKTNFSDNHPRSAGPLGH